MHTDARWPGVLEYIAAVQNAGRSFRDWELRTARFETDDAGDITTGQGQTATVFFADATDRQLAVRCFTRRLPDGAERYRQLGEFLRRVPVPPLAWADWIEEGIVVGEQVWPVVKMEQINGMPLGRYVEQHLDRPAVLLELAERWRRTAATLSAASVVHGDLQHDNIIVAPDGRLRLIDLDSVWVPGMADLQPDDNGHRNFQHPERLASGVWHRRIDAFPALVIYLSLRSVAAVPELWEYHNEENLILVDTDFQQPGTSSIWGRLYASPDLEVRDLTQLLVDFCRTSARVPADLEEILRAMRIPDGPKWTAAPVQPDEVDRWWHADGDDSPLMDELPAEPEPVPPDRPAPTPRRRPAVRHGRLRPRPILWFLVAVNVLIFAAILLATMR